MSVFTIRFHDIPFSYGRVVFSDDIKWGHVMNKTRLVPCGSQAAPTNTLVWVLANEFLWNAASFPLRNEIIGITLIIPS